MDNEDAETIGSTIFTANNEEEESHPENPPSTVVSLTQPQDGIPTPNPASDDSVEDAAVTHMKIFNGFVGHLSLNSGHVQWVQSTEGRGRILQDMDSNKPLNIVAPFQVMSYKYYVAPFGNHNGTYSLKNARYRFVGGPPSTEPFASLYKKGILLLKAFERKASERPSEHLFDKDASGAILGINFSYPVFKVREKTFSNKEVSYLDEMLDSAAFDEDPESPFKLSLYGLSNAQRKAYAEIVSKLVVQPLPVYKNGKFVYPKEVEDAMRSTVVQVQFNLINHFIEKDRTQSIIAKVVDVCVLHSNPGSPLKRRNVLDGPVTPDKQGSPSKKIRQ